MIWNFAQNTPFFLSRLHLILQSNFRILSCGYRRQFLSKTGRAGASALALGSLGVSKTMLATENFADYKALVCILLAGGNDSYNMLVPYDNEQ
ncbi:MAG: hypothetical protein CM1200mP24_07900 [Gammaproteobacteria bacterium]|nr:MAG: hypothetical protein CM1200mP24_07900 [Gammaproteobacteria bacterium]